MVRSRHGDGSRAGARSRDRAKWRSWHRAITGASQTARRARVVQNPCRQWVSQRRCREWLRSGSYGRHCAHVGSRGSRRSRCRCSAGRVGAAGQEQVGDVQVGGHGGAVVGSGVGLACSAPPAGAGSVEVSREPAIRSAGEAPPGSPREATPSPPRRPARSWPPARTGRAGRCARQPAAAPQSGRAPPSGATCRRPPRRTTPSCPTSPGASRPTFSSTTT